MKSLFIFVIFVTVTWAMPQRFPAKQFQGGNNNYYDGTTTAAPTDAVTTASPQFLACLQACPSTMEYNPVCGTDNQTYHNNGRLSCARRCGKNVSAVRLGICNLE